MKKQLLSLITLTLALSACSDFEKAEHRNPSVDPQQEQVDDTPSTQEDVDFDNGSYIIVDSTNSIDVSNGILELPGSALVDSIPELDVEVYEIDPDQLAQIDTEEVHIDEQVEMGSASLDENNALWKELSSRIDVVVGVVGSAPQELIQVCEANGNKVLLFQDSSESIYESEMIQGVIDAVEEEVDYLLIPVGQEDASDLMHSAAAMAMDKNIQVYDKFGVSF